MSNIPKVPAVLVVARRFSDSFMKDDLRILKRFSEPIACEYRFARLGQKLPGLARKFGTLAGIGLEVLRFLKVLLRTRTPLVIFWFAEVYHTPLMALVAKLFRRKVIVITGGVDSVYLPEFRWGYLWGRPRRASFRLLMRLADAVLPFSESAAQGITRNFRPRSIAVAYPSVDTRFFVPGGAARQPRVVTCAYAYDAVRLVQKGLASMTEVARRAPDVEFVIVGHPLTPEALAFQQSAPPNVRFLDRLPTRECYRDFLQRSSVYAQFSFHEGFGVSVAEAMACGCIPVVFDRYSLPEVVGDAGFVVPFQDYDAAVKAIRTALEADCAMRRRAHERVDRLFTKRVRYDVLLSEARRLVPSLALPVVRIELGCGSTGVGGTIGMDARPTVQTQVVGDVRHAPFASHIADEVYSHCVLEHLDNPYELMDEVVRLLKPGGRASLRVPNLGTFSAHLDTTHRFLADLTIWRAIMGGYFQKVRVLPLGTKYRDSRLLRWINAALVRGFGFLELTQGWEFVCERPREKPYQAYTGWWAETADR